jgi:four helix bundle protein
MDASRKPIRSYEDLEVYQRGRDLLRRVHKLVLSFPAYETYGLADQMRRATKSVPANIVEGYAKKRYPLVFKTHLVSAMGSANEMVAHLQIARDLEYISEAACAELVAEFEIVGKQLNVLASRWRDLGEKPVRPTSNLQRPGNQ